MDQLLITSIIFSIIAILLLAYVIFIQSRKKEGLCLCDNLGNKKIKDVDFGGALNYQYPSCW